MTARLGGIALVALLLGIPAGGQAFSFLAGGFAPGEQIEDIQLSAGLPGSPTVTFDTTTNTLHVEASVSRIDTNLDTYNISLGTVIFLSDVTIVDGGETVLGPIFPVFPGLVSAELLNGSIADITITDIADAGNLLLAGDYTTTLSFNATSPQGFGLPVTGSVGGDFELFGAGDPNFEQAFGSEGNYFANLTNFTSNGVPVTTDLCVLITPVCASGMQIDNFDVNPTATVVPLAVPEPGVLSLVGLAALGLAVRRTFLG